MSKTRWPQVPLGDILVRKQDWVAIEPDTEYRQVKLRLWGKGAVLRGIVRGNSIAASNQLRVKAGQFIVSKIDARNGAFGIVPPELDGAVVSQDFPAFDCDQERVVPQFLTWLSKTSWFVELCEKASEGSTNRVRLKEERFLSQLIPLPPLSTQQRIVEHLNASADLINKRKFTTGLVGRDVQATLTNAFAQIIDGAPRARMEQIAPLVRRPVEVSLESSYPELGVRSFGKGTFHKPALSGLDVGTKRLFRIEEGDLVFNIVFAWEGAVAVAQKADDGRVGSHRFLTCVPEEGRATSNFLRYFFLTKEGLERLGKASPGGAGRNRTLGVEALAAIEVPVLPLEQQAWFDKLDAKAFAARTLSKEAEEDLDKLILSILDRMF